MTKIGIHWFRKALRLHDNLPLLKAQEDGLSVMYNIFFLDPRFSDRLPASAEIEGSGMSLPSDTVFEFFFETLADLDKSLREKKSQLIVIRGDPVKVFPVLLEKLKVTNLYYEFDSEPYAMERDAEIENICKEKKVKSYSDYGHTLYDLDFLYEKAGNKVPGSYRGFLKVLDKAKHPHKPKDAPKGNLPVAEGSNDISNIKKDIEKASGSMNQYDFKIPTIKELDYKSSSRDKVNDYEIEEKDIDRKWLVGGESNGLKRMENFLKDEDFVNKFKKPNTKPNSLEPTTTVMSPYITNGSVSIRMLWHEINKVYEKSNGKHSQPPMSLHGQLYFREWFYLNSYKIDNFHKMKGNSLCKQISWDNDNEKIKKWQLGQTGFPFIDACMIQLRRTGWMHHLARHATACFLTRGDLWQSWEAGRDVFADYLLDGDYSLNSANWQWLSASAFFTAYFRVYSPIEFGKKTDRKGKFIRKYIPQLKNYSDKYIYQPWEAPKDKQQEWGCIIGKDYPEPMVDHKEAKEENMAKMKEAYAQNKLSGKKHARS